MGSERRYQRGNYQGVYTNCFLEAFRRPYASMVEMVEGKPVVPNRGRLQSKQSPRPTMRDCPPPYHKPNRGGQIPWSLLGVEVWSEGSLLVKNTPIRLVA
jgi:hypothetical protein